MAHDFSEDLDVFFDTEVFGEAVLYVAADGWPVPATMLRDRWEGPTRFGNAQIPSGVTYLMLRDDEVGQPISGATIIVEATGEQFELDGAPELSWDGALWRCAAQKT